MSAPFSNRPGVPTQDPVPIFGCNKTFSIDLTAPKRVLITGKNSFIGDSLLSYAKQHYPNLTLDVLDMRTPEWEKHNFTNYDSVFHVAGLAHADVGHVSAQTQEKYYQVNTDLAIKTAQKAQQSHVKQFIFMSSMIIYGESAPYGKQKVITCATQPAPANFYGDSKWQADKALRTLENPTFHVAIVRPPMVYGNGCKGNYPLLQKLARKLPVFPNVKNERSMVYIENLCEFICQLILSGENGIYFPQNAAYVNTAEMVNLLGNALHHKVHLSAALNPFVKLASYVPGKIRSLVNKAFGNCTYAQEISTYKGLNYQKYDLNNSIQSSQKAHNQVNFPHKNAADYPAFSVLMSVYAKDRPAWVHQALDSVLSNTLKPTEVVTVIDGPIPADLQAVLTEFSTKYPQVKLYPLAKNGGLGPALAYGLQQCSHELVARMDADDISLPDRFAKQLAYFTAYPNTDILGGQIQEIDGETLQPVAIRSVPTTDAQIKQYLKTRCPFNHMTVMYKKSAVLAAGNYTPFHLMEDYYLWARMAAAKCIMANLPDIVLNARVDAALYGRRGGWKYFKNNLAMSQKMRELGLISLPTHFFNTSVRFCVQVLMPNSVRGYFYKKALR